MTAPSGFPLATVYFVTNISQSLPGTVTVNAVTNPVGYSLAVGQTVTLSKVQGMLQVNDNRYVVGNLNTEAQTFQLYTIRGQAVDTSKFMPYVSGGEVNIISFPATATNPPGLMYNM
jgi:hypothetical protein